LNKETLSKACNKLEIEDVRLVQSLVYLTDSFRGLSNELETAIQRKRNVESVAFDEEELHYVYKVSFGIRLIKKDEIKSEDPEVLAEITAKFNVFYTASSPLPEDEQRVFGQENVLFNALPFWREYVENTCSRMGIQSFGVPLLKKGLSSKTDHSPKSKQ